ncbi:MAG: transcription termination/antitermination protein NusG, partial [Chloroflexota bacterium]
MQTARWYVVKTQPRREEQAEVVLGIRSVEVFLPRLPSRKKDRQGRHLNEPLFPGYLFARLAVPSPEWLAARSAPGVSYFLGMRSLGEPVPVPDSLVEEVRARAEDRLRRGWQPDFAHGDKVMITAGPLAGLEAAFDGLLSPKGRSRIFVEILSRLVPVEVEADLLR